MMEHKENKLDPISKLINSQVIEDLDDQTNIDHSAKKIK